MQSCLTIYRVWKACTEAKPEEPKPEPNLRKRRYLALEGKKEDDWLEYEEVNTEYNQWEERNEKAAVLIKRYVSETI